MYPKHRKEILKEIRSRLSSGEPCRLISTSLVEAGVDFDFPAVYRELAGIDSVIQAAGRCNQGGQRDPEECMTQVFTLEEEEDIHIPQELKLPISVAGQIVKSMKIYHRRRPLENISPGCTGIKGGIGRKGMWWSSLSREAIPSCFHLHRWLPVPPD